MKKISIFGVVAFAAMVVFNVNISVKNNDSDVVLANVEALANSEYLTIGCSGIPVPLVCFWVNGVPGGSGYVLYVY